MNKWVRDWVYSVIKPFLSQLKNRLNNIKLVESAGNRLKFTDANGNTTVFNGRNGFFINTDSSFDDLSSWNKHTSLPYSDKIVSVKGLGLKVKGTRSVISSNHTFKVPQTKRFEYKMVLEATGYPKEAITEKSHQYIYTECYDAEMNFIQQKHCFCRKDQNDNIKFSVLQQDLNVGDTTIIVDDASWFSTSNADHERSLAFHKLQDNGTYCYKSEAGTYYIENGYTRDLIYNNAYPTDGLVDNGDGTWTINLAKPYSGSPMPKGTHIRDTQDGGTYCYRWNGEIVLDRKRKVRMSDWYQWDPSDPIDFYKCFRNGTHYANVGLLPTYYFVDKDGNRTYNLADAGDAYMLYHTVGLQSRPK